jgi:predicted helicase
VVELYDKFFKSAFPKLTQRMGIVYTPVEIVDFIIKSVEEVLNEEFGQSISDEGVHVIDPFTGTGTFITRLLQSGLIKPEDMARKFREEIHANEIVLLAYYIAAINIEAVFHDQTGTYEPFPGICLTDTFQLYEKDDQLLGLMEDNGARRTRQKNQPIRVIIGNPPYSDGQENANDDAANVDYPDLDSRIATAYAARSAAKNKNALYNSYIRAIRWGSDRLKDWGGVLAFVTNAGWVDAKAADGLRKSFAEEFTRIDVFHLRGNANTSGLRRRKEAGNVFEMGTKTPIAVFVLTLNPANVQRGRIRFHELADFLSVKEKLEEVGKLASLSGITKAEGWQTIEPDVYGDWLNQRTEDFNDFISMSIKERGEKAALFETYSRGAETGRDAWVVNHGISKLKETSLSMMAEFNEQLASSHQRANGTRDNANINRDPRRIKWTSSLYARFERGEAIENSNLDMRISLARPFSKEWLVFNTELVHRPGQMPKFFPTPAAENRLIMIKQRLGSETNFALMLSAIPDLQTDGGAQNFPRYIYAPAPQTLSTDGPQTEMFAADKADPDAPKYIRTDAITDAGLQHFADAYPGHPITKDDIFDYVYGILHHPTYRERYADNLTKQLPRIPLMKFATDFAAVAAAGKALGNLHVNYETVDPWPVTIAGGDLALAHIPDPVAYWRVEKMKFGGKRPNLDKTTIHYNARVTISGIPPRAYDYVVNGKSAIDWVMERQCVKTDPASGIISDANAYATETIGDPRYPFDLLCRVITVSMRTLDIVDALPPFDIVEG